MFCDLVGLSAETVQQTLDVVACMNEVFSCFDDLMDKYDVYKVQNASSYCNSFTCIIF